MGLILNRLDGLVRECFGHFAIRQRAGAVQRIWGAPQRFDNRAADP
jgi:hypothetical protein